MRLSLSNTDLEYRQPLTLLSEREAHVRVVDETRAGTLAPLRRPLQLHRRARLCVA